MTELLEREHTASRGSEFPVVRGTQAELKLSANLPSREEWTLPGYGQGNSFFKKRFRVISSEYPSKCEI